jgi:hypothetical protein
MTTSPHKQLARYWRDSGADIRLGSLNLEAVAALEAKYDVTLPAEFRAYLLECAPEDDQVDQNCTEWWSLRRIKNIPDEYEHALTNTEIEKDAAAYLFFADFMIWCMAWAICCQPGVNYGRVVVISGSDRFAADSFGEFVERYVRNHDDLI